MKKQQVRNVADIITKRFARRTLVQGGASLSLLAFLGGCKDEDVKTPGPALPDADSPPASDASVGGNADAGAPDAGPLMGFNSVPISKADTVVVPPGYAYDVVSAWGDPVVKGAADFKSDASQSAADQALQAGCGHDGMVFYPLPKGSTASDHGLIAINYEYGDDNLTTTDGMAVWTPEKVKKSQNAHGLGVLEIKLEAGKWKAVRDSAYGRRITAQTPFTLRGRAAGHSWMKTAADPEGKTVLGTFNNCASGQTPWGTYLSCEENVTPYFAHNGSISKLQDRYGVPAEKDNWGFRWHEHDERFDAARHPNEPNRHGWVVEIDPFDPHSVPVKRTALGRLAHEGATLAVSGPKENAGGQRRRQTSEVVRFLDGARTAT